MKKLALILFSVIFLASCDCYLYKETIEICEQFCGDIENIKFIYCTNKRDTDSCYCNNKQVFTIEEIKKMNEYLKTLKAEKE